MRICALFEDGSRSATRDGQGLRQSHHSQRKPFLSLNPFVEFLHRVSQQMRSGGAEVTLTQGWMVKLASCLSMQASRGKADDPF
jgi:hypothetical protein